ncbi:MAG: prolyl oligopeptidase family serine peptidase [Acidobacteriota bacterium]
MNSSRVRTLVWFVASVLVVAGAAIAQPGPTVDQLINLKRAGAPAISPDGSTVAYAVREPDWEANVYKTEIWLVDVASGKRRQLTNSKKSSGAPDWSPDGKKIAFTSDRSDKMQIWAISPDAGEAEALTSEADGVDGAFAWSPDGRSIAYTKGDPESEARKERDKKYGAFEIVDRDYALSHLWVIDVATKKSRRLTQGPFTVGSFAWSPDGRDIAFDHTKTPALSDSGTGDISVVRVADGKIRPLVTQPGPDSQPVWSPDGRQIAFASALGSRFDYFTNGHIAVVPSNGGPIEDLTKEFDEDISPTAWKKDGIYFTSDQHTWSYLYRLDPASHKATRLAPGIEWIISNVSVTSDASMVAFRGSGPKQFPEIFVAPLSTMAPRTLTDMAAQVSSWPQPSHEVITWKSQDGTAIEGVLHKPATFQAGKRYPLLVVIHGGPTGTSRPVPFSSTAIYPIDIWLSKGAIVLEPNYRGSAGYGEAFRSLNVRNLGIGDAWDVLSGIDYLVAQGMADNDRVGTMGWSQGGYISAFLTTHDSARFKAVSVGAGISDWTTYYVNTDIHPFTRQYLKATPWDDPKVYADTSPITYVKKAKAPTLIQHGELDKRVPTPNAYELYQGLLDQGVTAKLIIYKGFGHGLTKPKAQRAATEHNLEWFGQYIWGEKPEAPSTVAPVTVSSAAPVAASVAAAPKAARVQEFPGVVNFAPVDDSFACGGAMKPAAVEELKKRGYKSVVNFRPTDEDGANVAEEKAAVEKEGLAFIHVPFRRTDENIEPAVDAFLAAVKNPVFRPMLFHCATGIRASAMWFFKRVLVEGWPADKAMAEAEALGLTSAPARQWALGYVKAHSK